MEKVGEIVTKEEWRQVEDAVDGVVVSNWGRFKRQDGLIAKLNDNGNGYLTANYKCSNGDYKIRYIHRLVASYFLENPNNCKYVNHKDSIKENNRADNLEWCTAKQNTAHGIKNGTINKKGRRCVRHPDEVIQNMYILHKGGMSLSAIEREYGVSRTTMASIIKGDVRKEVLKGLKNP